MPRPWRQGTGATHPLAGGTMGEWASAGDPSHEYIVQGTARAKARVRVHSGQDATRRTRRERREAQWERSSTNLSEEELRKRGAKQVRCARLFLVLLCQPQKPSMRVQGGGESAYHAVPWGAKPSRKVLAAQMKFGQAVSAATWDRLI